MVPDFVLKSVVTAASYWGTSIPIRRVLLFAQFGPTRMGRIFGESHGKKAKKQ
jgi:hypothetical protein